MLLSAFRQHCATWPHDRHDDEARVAVYLALIQRHGRAAVVRHVRWIRAVLDATEDEVRQAEK